MSHDIVLVYARAANGAIGHEGLLPWHLPADLAHFKRLTMGADGRGRPMIMGRKTFESLPRLLPGRRHIVLTRRERWDSEGAEIAASAQAALVLAQQENDSGEIMVVGGAAIYDVFRPIATRIELTQIHEEFEGDVFMKPLGPEWQRIACENHERDGNRPAFSFETYRRLKDMRGDVQPRGIA
ncbi:MAG: dihydrofolate reductase [Erythrobacter sp.]